ncbi:MAG: hypothetical protein IPO49_01065 [Bacteroidetes bacterium]|nr:hypothetical protein [Bacteroidota bacterium]
MLINSRVRFLFLFLSISICCCFAHVVYAQNWTALGPDSFPTLIRPFDFSLKNAQGIGRVTGVFFEPRKKCFFKKNTPKLFVGSPYGGLWESTDQGKRWQASATNNLPNPGIAALAFHPQKYSIRYLATGDPDCILNANEPAAGCEYCQGRGIVKSTDAGKTWSNPIGTWYSCDGKADTAFWSFPSKKVIRKLVILPKHPSTLLAVIHTYVASTKSFDGYVYRSEDAGENWHPVLCAKDGFLKDLEFQPGDENTVYVSGRTIFKSSDAGKTWQAMPNRGLPEDSLVMRCELAVSPANPQFVYALFVLKKSYTSDFYLSENSGISFKKKCAVPSSPEWRTTLCADPVNAQQLYFSAGNRVNKLFLTDGKWSYKNAGDGLHDDLHDLNFDPAGNKLYASTDGGLYTTTDGGTFWLQESRGLNIAECWNVAVSKEKPYRILVGMQDCGTQQFRPSEDSLSGWFMVRGGDGMECAIDPLNPKIMYANDGNNNLTARSEDGGITWSRNLAASRMERGNYLRPFQLDPANPHVLYTGYHNVFRSKNQGETWTMLAPIDLADKNASLIAIALAPTDSQIIYIAYSNPTWNTKPTQRLYKSKDGGNSWTDITAGLKGVSYTQITSIAVQPDDANVVLVGFRGGWEYKLMKTLSGGEGKSAWTNYSSGLPSEGDVNCILFDKDKQHSVYIGTHSGVYVSTDYLKAWQSFSRGLPRVMVCDLDILQASRELYIGTHGRGVWKSPLLNP